MTDIQRVLEAARRSEGPLTLATLVRVEGSSYRRPGARVLMDEHGPLLGSISGGCLETDVLARAEEVRRNGAPRLLRYDLRSDLDLIWGTGSGCEGVAEILVEPFGEAPWLKDVEKSLAHRRSIHIATRLDGARLGERFVLEETQNSVDADLFVETFRPPIALWIFGAGDDAKPLVSMAKALGYFVALVDHRPAFVTAERFPEADALHCSRPPGGLSDIQFDARCATVLMTHHFEMDSGWLRILLRQPAAYVGLMGHRRRSGRILAESGEALTAAQAERFFSPVGLDLGSESPESIALSILAEIQAVFGNREPRHLRSGRGAIHENPT